VCASQLTDRRNFAGKHRLLGLTLDHQAEHVHWCADSLNHGAAWQGKFCDTDLHHDP
jgi:hypothetical protein